MPQYGFNPAAVDAGFPVYPKGQYEMIIGDPKPFLGKAIEAGSTKTQNYGVRYALIIAEGEKKGKKAIMNCYMHVEASQGFAKQFLMAAAGFNPKDQDAEARYNEESGAKDWTYDPDTGRVGEAWLELRGKRILIDLDVTMDKDQKEQQKWVGFIPFVSA